MNLSKQLAEHPQVLSMARVWKSSANTTAIRTGSIDELNGVVMASGLHVWKIQTFGGHISLGVLSTTAVKTGRPSLNNIAGGWAYGSLGDAWTGGKKLSQAFTGYTDSVVTIFLDLDGNGTMSVAIDDKCSIEVFTDMKKFATEFVPAIDIHDSKSYAVFLGFE